MHVATHESRFIRWFDEISVADVPSVGGKNASLGELYRRESHRSSEPNQDTDLFAEFARQFDRRFGSPPTTPHEDGATIHAEISLAQKR
jgi:hypothetical protein